MRNYSGVIAFCFLLCVFACTEEEKENTTNGFTADGQFYATPYAEYHKSGTNKDYAFTFSSKDIEGNKTTGYKFVGIENSTLNAVGIGDLTLANEGEFVGEFFFDNTETLDYGIDSYNYFANLEFDADRNAINPPDYHIIDGTFTIKSKSANVFDIEYEASFDNGVSIKGKFKGEVKPLD